ncbi:hypothetical protein [Thiomicrorhabdus xiamenensis]|uniref:Uncharacterized protein n=1 Tax=Thiomicrorhabdus xiamenensis TaxID=2739063 RepID=A0A7D4T9H2_9GAMM|nr:hypothetical protein [Thiomicrorhabdus xiamenensis]QKI88546.1 hypothetical protein HQN79_02625 [Thiomicrorhabdus xiamenensis]
MNQLEHVKQRLLNFAVLHPEIYQTNSASQLQDAANIPSIGYFPCPDLDGDGFLLGAETTCGNPYLPLSAYPDQTGFVPDPLNNSGAENCNGTGYCMGFVPQKISSREFYFAPAQRFYYVLDERFSFQNPNYVNNGVMRFAPLNPQVFETGEMPRLNLNGVGGYVFLIIDAGSDGLSAENANGDHYFVNQSNGLVYSETDDRVVGVTFSEWKRLMQIRSCRQLSRLNGVGPKYTEIDPLLPHWMNAYQPLTNAVGADWRQQCHD